MNAVTPNVRIDCVVESRDRLGETPLWCDRTQKLWWIDIENPALRSYDPASGAQETVALPGTYAGSQALTKAGDRLLVNELAPRVHNSGHWTIDACAVSQFEQHIRAIAGWPLAAPSRHSNAVMENAAK